MQLNAQLTISSVGFDKTLYHSPLMVMTDQEYTKHYFIEGERICSKTCAEPRRGIGGGFGSHVPDICGQHLSFIHGDEISVAADLGTMISSNLACAEFNGEWKVRNKLLPAHNSNTSQETSQFFYHPDHLGSSSMITNATGTAEQHIQYLPYGELFVSQRNSTFDSRYKFTAKELDNETNYTYFGARYYDSDASIWLSVDPMSDKYPSLSPYAYVANNPVVLVDPNGMDIYIIDPSTGKKYRYDPNKENTSKNTFVLQVINDLNSLKSTNTGNTLVQELHSANYEYIIENARGECKISPTDKVGAGLAMPSIREKEKRIGTGSGAIILYDPNLTLGGIDINGNDERPSFIGLGHEFAHGLQIKEGRYTTDVDKREIEASHIENMIRSENSLPLRKMNNSITPPLDILIDSKGKQIGTGYDYRIQNPPKESNPSF